MKKILYISPYPPVANVQGAGGQIAHYYVNKLAKDTDISLWIICGLPENDITSVDFASQGLQAKILIIPQKTFFDRVKSKFNFKLCGILDSNFAYSILKSAIEIRDIEKFIPDYIILDWEDIGYILTDLKKIFPLSIFSVIEQDVISQSLYRYYKSSRNFVKKWYKWFQFRNCLRLEKQLFTIANHVIVFSKKDEALVREIFLGAKVSVLVPYYHLYTKIPLQHERVYDILFYGLMSRKENYEAAERLIQKIMPHVPECRCVILGGNTPNSLKKMQNEKVFIAGFQTEEQLEEWFKNSLCMVVPLIHGAGIKIKVLEAMSAGIPVLTNEIGIEGIPAVDGHDYLHCESNEDFVHGIQALMGNMALAYKIGNNSRQLCEKEFNYEKSSYLNENIVL